MTETEIVIATQTEKERRTETAVIAIKTPATQGTGTANVVGTGIGSEIDPGIGTEIDPGIETETETGLVVNQAGVVSPPVILDVTIDTQHIVGIKTGIMNATTAIVIGTVIIGSIVL
jgi:hypothetical protein